MQTYSVFPNQAQDGGGDGVVSDILDIVEIFDVTWEACIWI